MVTCTPEKRYHRYIKTREYLGKLRVMTEYVAYITVAARFNAVAFAVRIPFLKVAEQCLTRNQKFVGHTIPRTDEQFFCFNELFDPLTLFGTDLKIIS
jgi:hypothetical protein